MKKRLSSVLAVLTLILLFGFPKAGFYVGNIPVTFGYLLLALMAVGETMHLAIDHKRSIEPRYLGLGLLIFCLAIVEIVSFRLYGSKSMGAMVSILVSTIGMPIIAILATHWMLRVLGLDSMLAALRWALVPVLAFGMLAFVAYNATGTITGVPFLTTTGSDISSVVSRHNLRGPIIKMFSTYNNGNILGINLLMWGTVGGVCIDAQHNRVSLTLRAHPVALGLGWHDHARDSWGRSRPFFGACAARVLRRDSAGHRGGDRLSDDRQGSDPVPAGQGPGRPRDQPAR